MKEFLKKFIPTVFYSGGRKIGDQRIITSFGLQRSGQHLIIEWICRGLPEGTIHFNNCDFRRAGLAYVLRPMLGRRVIYSTEGIHDSRMQPQENLRESLPDNLPRNLFYSMEDQDPQEFRYGKLLRTRRPVVVLILRDPANWLASSMKHGLHSPTALCHNKELLKRYLRIALGKETDGPEQVVAVNYNRFIVDAAYRAELAASLGGMHLEEAEVALGQVPAFGGGSSFEGKDSPSKGTTNRWRSYEDDPFFAGTLKDPELLALSEAFFGDIEALQVLRQYLKAAG